jgi:exopolysaccharide biosynthesis operon protein EpsL
MNTRSSDFTRVRLAVLAAVSCAMPLPGAFAAEIGAADSFQFFVMDRYWYDDNLFRVPDGLLETEPAIAGRESEDDYVNRASAGVRVRLDQSRQVLHADLRIDDVRYNRNDDLNYTGGNADLSWDWQLGRRFSGKLFGQFDRVQAALNNYRFFERDIVDTAGYGGEFRVGIGSRWRLLAAAAATDTDHSSPVRQLENFESTSGRGGIEYATPAGSLLALEYRVTDADFPIAADIAGAPRGYQERVPGIRIEYPFTVQTRLIARAGYLDRDYDNPVSGDYAGEIWNATLQWEPRAKLGFDLKAWHELRAYTDAESDYFIADGVSITPKWKPRTTLEVSATYSYEKQDYTGTSLVFTPVEEASREDKLKSALFSIDYSPRDLISLGLGYRWIDRTSNREFRDYGANVVSVDLKLTF